MDDQSDGPLMSGRAGSGFCLMVCLKVGGDCGARASVFLMLPGAWRMTTMPPNGARNYRHVSTVLGRVGEMIHKRAGMQPAYAQPEADTAKAFGRPLAAPARLSLQYGLYVCESDTELGRKYSARAAVVPSDYPSETLQMAFVGLYKVAMYGDGITLATTPWTLSTLVDHASAFLAPLCVV